MNLDSAENHISRCDSYTRLKAIVELCNRMESSEWLELLGKYWSACDNIASHLNFILFESPLKDRKGPVREMMNEDEWKQLMALPAKFPVYRGCFVGINTDGHCYSLSRETAISFTKLTRYRHSTAPAVLRAGYVLRDEDVIALKNDRNESEIIIREATIENDIPLDEKEWPDDCYL